MCQGLDHILAAQKCGGIASAHGRLFRQPISDNKLGISENALPEDNGSIYRQEKKPSLHKLKLKLFGGYDGLATFSPNLHPIETRRDAKVSNTNPICAY